MIEDVTTCPISGIPIDNNTFVQYPGDPLNFAYQNRVIGAVKISHLVYTIFMDGKWKDIKYMVAGICRQHFEKYKQPFELTYEFLDNGYKNFSYPKKFKEKGLYLLKYIYENGGEEYKTVRFEPRSDFPLSYATDRDEFSRLITMLEQKQYVEFESNYTNESGELVVAEIRMTETGIEEVEKELIQFPMIELVDQNIFTCNIQIDDKINHAKKLFFGKDSTMNDKRSACETLSHVLEPLRDRLKKYFTDSDVSDFFHVVNQFDVRHNKMNTKKLLYDEQLDWIFYSLINTIITYFKLEEKLK